MILPYPISSNNDTGLLNASGGQFVGVVSGILLAYVFGKGKMVPTAIGAGLGYALGPTIIEKLGL